ncbi:MAG: CRISPR-associated endonuclease Cas1 [Nitrososphaerales archaeon]
MKRLVIDGFGKYVGVKGERIVVKENSSVIYQVLPSELRQVLITGKGTISFDAINILSKNGVDIVFVNKSGELTARLSPLEFRTVLTRREQYYAYRDKRSVILAKEFALSKLKNQYATLGTLAKRRKETNPEASDFILNQRDMIYAKLLELEKIKGDNIDSVREVIMGLEGAASASYWSALTAIISDEFGFKGRSGRYATDPVNALLNYGYGVLEGEVWRAIHFSGLDPYGGFLHADRPGKPSMVLDLMEEFRQQIVDKIVIKLLTKREVKPEDFTIQEGSCILKDNTRRILLRELLEKFEEYISLGDEKVRWCDLILNQARKVGSYLRGEITKYEGFWLRW